MKNLDKILNEHDNILLKIDQYRTIWFIISGLIFSIIMVIFFFCKFGGNVEYKLINDIILFTFLIMSIIWWSWTMVMLIQLIKQ